MDKKNRARISFWFHLVLLTLSHIPFSKSLTDPRDVNAINNLYTSLGSPAIPGWIANGGDPCSEQWQGVLCVNSNITSITMNAANLGGELGNSLGNFTSIVTLDFSNNNIGGSIPENLPLTIQRIFLSANQLTGRIPASLSQLTFLTDMSLNGNLLSGELPDSFQSLTGIINLDLSSNNFSGPLPPSMASLSALTTLRIQQNKFSGVLDVLEDLPLKDLNVENNSFSGPIPAKLLSIPNFKKDGNPFNTSIIIAPSAQPPASTAPPPFVSGPPSPSKNHTNSSSPSDSGSSDKNSSPSSPSGSSKKSNTSTLKIIGYALVGVVSFIVLVLMVLFCLSKIQERRSRESDFAPAKAQASRMHGRVDPPIVRAPPVKQNNEVKKATKEDSRGRLDLEMGHTIPAIPKKETLSDKRNSYTIDMENSTDEFILVPPPPPPTTPPPPPPPPPPPLPVREVTNTSTSTVPATSATSFSVANLQQYTRNFSEDNLIRESRLGRVYLAELPEGELLEVMKIDNTNSKIAVDEFLDLVLNISELRHPNVLELVGYCAEFGQRLLVYTHFSRRSLQDVLHEDDTMRRSLTWNARIKIALGAAKALEYLHEGCQPQMVHQNFEPSNILLDRKMSVRVAECGLASLLMSVNSVAQLSGRMRSLYYEAPEISESGSSFTDRSDVYSFGVVMLELLTGRKPYDTSRPRAEQHLVRWASSQLHDIDALSSMVDLAIKGMCSDKSLSNFADIITRCIQLEPEFRPQMSEIVQDLSSMIRPSREPSK